VFFVVKAFELKIMLDWPMLKVMGSLENHAFSLMYGKDRVCRRDENLVVYSMCDDPEWEIREYRKIGITIGDDGWYLSAKEIVGKRGIRYTLSSWPEHIHRIPGR
jgi:hypothetical protein